MDVNGHIIADIAEDASSQEMTMDQQDGQLRHEYEGQSEHTESQPYGYLLAHFIENARGYAEKLYLDISHGNDPTRWDRLNAGRPVLASAQSTTGIRDPCICKNPQTGEYFIVATDLRVFGGDNGSQTAGTAQNPQSLTDWAYWSQCGTGKLIVWRSRDLVDWGEPEYLDACVREDGSRANLGMAWAPVATWEPNLYGPSKGGFVVVFSADLMDPHARRHDGNPYSRLLWATTTDFTPETFKLGGVFIDDGGETIDCTIIRRPLTSEESDGLASSTAHADSATQEDRRARTYRTYRIYKDNSFGRGIRMQSTDDQRWWDNARWRDVQDQIGARYAVGQNPGGVEGPAVFAEHSGSQWMLFVDVIPSIGYRPLVTNDLDAGWKYLSADQLSKFRMAPHTKHGVVLPLTRQEYDCVRAGDAIGFAARADAGIPEIGEPLELGEVRVDHSQSKSKTESLSKAVIDQARHTYPSVSCVLSDGSRAQMPIVWDRVETDDRDGSVHALGYVKAISSNYSSWTSQGGTNAWDAPDRRLERSTALTVSCLVRESRPVAPSDNLHAE
jgi:hypothetical protein